MFDVHIQLDDINISSIEKQDVLDIQKWINHQNNNSDDNDKQLPLKEFYERFLEYYISESEFFLKVSQGDILIGVLKGRIEFKITNEVWFTYYILDNTLRGKGIGSKIIEAVMGYFSNSLGMDSFYTTVCEKDTRIIKFWKNNNFKIYRVSKSYFNNDGQDLDMIIMKV